MVDNLLKKELLIKSEAFFISKIDKLHIKQCLNIENSAKKTRSIRSEKEFLEILNKYTCYGLFNKNNDMLSYAFFSVVLDEAELLDINLYSNMQAKGIGTAFLDNCLQLLKQQNINEIILEVATDNTKAIKAYQKFNCQQIGIRKNYYKNTDGSKTDAFVYNIKID